MFFSFRTKSVQPDVNWPLKNFVYFCIHVTITIIALPVIRNCVYKSDEIIMQKD